jgi:thioredoxin reductase (NADPH)
MKREGSGMSDEYDVTVIGAGPVGLFTAFYAGMRNLRTLVLEALPRPGGQITALYPEKYIYDVGGFPAILGRDLVTELYEQSSQFGADFKFSERVESLQLLEPGHLQLTTTEETYLSKTAIIAAGIGAFQPTRLHVAGLA